MVDQKKIIIMTKLALYEKKYMHRDRRKLNYFIEDYIYINNFKARLGITLIILFNIILGGFKIINRDIIIPTSMHMFMDAYIAPYILPWLAGMIIYTFISTYLSGMAYKRAGKRFNEYKRLLGELEKYESHQVDNEGAADEI